MLVGSVPRAGEIAHKRALVQQHAVEIPINRYMYISGYITNAV